MSRYLHILCGVSLLEFEASSYHFFSVLTVEKNDSPVISHHMITMPKLDTHLVSHHVTLTIATLTSYRLSETVHLVVVTLGRSYTFVLNTILHRLYLFLEWISILFVPIFNTYFTSRIGCEHKP